MKKLQIEPLSSATFAPYGAVLGRPSAPADIEKGWLSYWHCLGEPDFRDRPVWGCLEVRHRPARLTELERHCGAAEVFVPLGTGSSVMAFALGGTWSEPAANPDPDTLRLFHLDGEQAFVVGRGVWHTPAFPEGDSAKFLLLLEERTPSEDIDIRDIGPYEFELCSCPAEQRAGDCESEKEVLNVYSKHT